MNISKNTDFREYNKKIRDCRSYWRYRIPTDSNGNLEPRWFDCFRPQGRSKRDGGPPKNSQYKLIDGVVSRSVYGGKRWNVNLFFPRIIYAWIHRDRVDVIVTRVVRWMWNATDDFSFSKFKRFFILLYRRCTCANTVNCGVLWHIAWRETNKSKKSQD